MRHRWGSCRAPGAILGLGLAVTSGVAGVAGVAADGRTAGVAGAVVAAGAAADAAAPATVRSSGPFVRAVGTVQDGGLPQAGCGCPRCESARHDPRARRARRWVASLVLALPESGKLFLLDVTPDLRLQLDLLRDLRPQRAGAIDRAPVDGVFLTHAHIGHYLGLAQFGFEAVNTHGLPVYASARMGAFLRRNAPWDQLVRLENITLREIQPGTPTAVGSAVDVTALAVPHRAEYTDTLAFLVSGPHRRLLYVPDTDGWETWPRPLIEALRGVDIAILDGTFFSAGEVPGRDPASIRHPLIPRTMDLLQPLVTSGKLRVDFTHLNHTNPALDPKSPERAEVEKRGFHVLAEGGEFPL